jgi:hypothetical protein
MELKVMLCSDHKIKKSPPLDFFIFPPRQAGQHHAEMLVLTGLLFPLPIRNDMNTEISRA